MTFKVFGKKMDKIGILCLSLLGVLLFHLFYGCTVCREGQTNMNDASGNDTGTTDASDTSDASGNEEGTRVALTGGPGENDDTIKTTVNAFQSHGTMVKNAEMDQVAGFDDGVKPIPQSI